MITFLRGRLIEKTPVSIVIDVGGVGYKVFISLSTLDALPENGEPTTILTRFIVREDSQQLYGFATALEREVFDHLISVTGIGPRLALAVLSGMSVNDFLRAVHDRNELALTAISGIGKKTAARLVLELAEKLGRLGWGETAKTDEISPAGQGDEGAIDALMALGMTRAEAAAKLGKARAKLGSSAGVEDLIKTALRT